MSEITLKLTTDQLQVIGDALGNHPFKLAAPVFNEIQKQINEQEQAAQRAAAAPHPAGDHSAGV